METISNEALAAARAKLDAAESQRENILLFHIANGVNIESRTVQIDEGVVIAYTSIYGHTKEAVEELAEKLNQRGCPNVVVADLARCDMAEIVADAFDELLDNEAYEDM